MVLKFIKLIYDRLRSSENYSPIDICCISFCVEYVLARSSLNPNSLFFDPV